MIGQTISHYRITEKLGEGGMGVVYKAEDIKLKRSVALKFLAPHLLRDEEGPKRFEREAMAAASLDHPNICTVHEIDEVDGRTFIVMAFLEGRTLSKKIAEGPLKLPEALSIAIQMAEGLDAAHEKGTTHRDIKPDNVMLMKGSRGLVKLMDFGLAQLAESSKLTREGTTLGTPVYMSPEQALGEPTDRRSDVWGLGVVLYEMVAGQPPFKGEVDHAVIYSITNEQHEPLTALRTGVPKELERIVDKCLAKEADERYQHVTDLLVDLQALRRDLEPQTSKVATQPGAARSTSPAVIGAAAAILLVAVGLTWWFTRSSELPSPSVPQYKLSQITQDTGYSGSPALSPDGKLLAYASDRADENNLDIWVQQVAGGEPIRLTNHPTNENSPSFSPDGSRIVFESGRDAGGIYVIPALGGNAKRVADSSIHNPGKHPRFSPDGEWISYSLGRAFIVPAAGGPARELESGLSVSRNPVWSPDGRHLLVEGSVEPWAFGRFVEFDWWVVPVQGGRAIRLDAAQVLENAGLALGAPFAWLADGNRIPFTGSLRGGATNLWQVRISPDDWRLASEPRRLTSGTGEDAPSAASDGLIAFTSSSLNWDIWRLRVDMNRAEAIGTPERVITGLSRETHPTLSADGRKLLFISDRAGNSDVWLRDLATGSDQPVTISAQPELRGVISPDGARAAFVRDEQRTRNLYVSDLASGTEKQLLQEIGNVFYWLPDGKKILYYSLPPRRWLTFDVETGESTDLGIGHSQYPVGALKFSADQRWVSFKLKIGQDRLGPLFVAPVEGDTVADESRWVQITDKYYDGQSWWSPDGNVLYFTSLRDGFWCIWTQRLDPGTKKAVGTPTALQHFHGLRRRLGSPPLFGYGVTADRLYFPIGETKANIWLAEPAPTE